MPPPPPPGELRHVDPRIWRACAGASVQIPLLHSRVYYFPQGHLEQSSSSSPPTVVSPLALSKSIIPCFIAAVHFFADPLTDEVFTKLLLHPITPAHLSARHHHQLALGGSNDDQDGKIVAFAKILTPSDANNGGGFSVPRFCADSIFPLLNYHAEPPVQTLSVTDVHGAVWEFRHIYRGTPRRHLLTTGWSKFVNHKKLIAGDSVVFMKNSRGKMFIGVRRAVRFANGSCDYARWRNQIGGGLERAVGEEIQGEGVGGEGFARSGSGRGRLTPEAVAEAAERAALGRPFEVVYYPRAGCSDFIVKAEVVEAALSIYWVPGMRIKMAMETEDSSRMTWFQGTVSSAQVRESGPWSGSPWRMLQITWDEPEILQSAKRVNPWQVEFLAPTPPLQTTFPPVKKFKFSQDSGFVSEGDGEIFFPTTGLNNSTMGQLRPPLLNYKTFPAGMQGARQDNFRFFSLNNFMNENSSQMCTDNFFSNNIVPKLKRVSTELNIGSPQSDNLSPDSQSSFHSFVTDSVGNRGYNATKVGISSFQLFGKVIHMEEPIESGFDAGCMEDDSTRGCSETEGVNNLLDLSLTYPYIELLDRLDAQCQRAAAVEACSL